MGPYSDHNRKILSPLDKEPYIKKEEKLTQTDSAESEKKVSGGTVVDHLAELRKQLIKSALVFLAFLVLVFSTLNIWFPYVTRGYDLVVFGPFQIIKFYSSICVTLSLGLALPFLVHFIWQFIRPGLNPAEIRFLGLYSPVMFFLFIGGVAFGYFVVNPLSYQFLIGFGAHNFDVMVSAQEYVHFLIMTTIPLGFLFELPIVAMFLAATGVLTADRLVQIRKWSYLIMAIVSALITPPDFISQLMVLIPMAVLYEASISIVRRMEQKKSGEAVEMH
ncbi:MAG TPA: twin-arginine translocase subunit TatC [Bacillaceae bacterium]